MRLALGLPPLPPPEANSRFGDKILSGAPSIGAFFVCAQPGWISYKFTKQFQTMEIVNRLEMPWDLSVGLIQPRFDWSFSCGIC